MQSVQKIMASIQPNFISLGELSKLIKTSIDLQVDDKKKEEMQDIHREMVKGSLTNMLKQSQKGRKRKT